MTEGQLKRQVLVSRHDLYAQVWQTPMHKLGEHYGISGNGLAKICRRLAIPYPGRGYWARKAAGQKLKQPRLPDATDGIPLQVTISPSLPPPSPPQLSPDLQDKITAARKLTSRIVVSTRMARPHPIIANWLEEHKRRRQDIWHRQNSPVPHFSEVERRRHRILDTLFKVLEREGFKAKTGERGEVYLEIERERVEFDLKEKFRQVRRPLTEDEKRWGFNRNKPWKQELQPTGALVFLLRTRLDLALRHEWIDEPEVPIEKQLPEIAATLLLAGPILRERRRQREEAERRRQIQERRRYEEGQRIQQDRNRWRHFVNLALRWREAETARQFLAALESRLEGCDATFDDRSGSQWVEWAREHVAKYDPLFMGAAPVLEDVAGIDSWPIEIDPHHRQFNIHGYRRDEF